MATHDVVMLASGFVLYTEHPHKFIFSYAQLMKTGGLISDERTSKKLSQCACQDVTVLATSCTHMKMMWRSSRAVPNAITLPRPFHAGMHGTS